MPRLAARKIRPIIYFLFSWGNSFAKRLFLLVAYLIADLSDVKSLFFVFLWLWKICGDCLKEINNFEEKNDDWLNQAQSECEETAFGRRP